VGCIFSLFKETQTFYDEDENVLLSDSAFDYQAVESLYNIIVWLVCSVSSLYSQQSSTEVEDEDNEMELKSELNILELNEEIIL